MRLTLPIRPHLPSVPVIPDLVVMVVVRYGMVDEIRAKPDGDGFFITYMDSAAGNIIQKWF